LYAVSLVDDNPALLSIYKETFEQMGCRVSAYGTAKSALDGITKNGDWPSLLLLDYSLPDMDAESFVEELKAGNPDAASQVRIIVFSSFDAKAPQIQRLLPHVSQFIQKPLDLITLEDLARTLTPKLDS